MFDENSGNLKKVIGSFSLLLVAVVSLAQQKGSTVQYSLPDSVKAVSMIATVEVGANSAKQEAGIKANEVSLALQIRKGRMEVRFLFPNEMPTVATGLNVTSTHSSRIWETKPINPGMYKLLLVSVGDSAENFMLYSGYVYLPAVQKWKLIGTCKIANQWGTLKTMASFTTDSLSPAVSNVWCQRGNGSWKSLAATEATPPVLAPFSNIDSAAQFMQEKALLDKNILQETGTVYKEGVYYTILKQGEGKKVAVTDTVSVFYKGYLYANGNVFDETKGKPARFPLARLIKGWQIGLANCQVGGKIKLFIPSGQAYSIRTRAAKIPPNSILVFEIEVLKVDS